MTYYETPGVLEDIADFMVHYYNDEYLIKRYSFKNNDETNNFMEFSYELRSMIGDLPEELHPFAYSSDKTVAFITSVIKKVDFVSVTLDSFLKYMHSTNFLNDFCHHWFNIDCDIKTIEDIKNNKLTDLVNSLPHPEDIKYKLFLVLSHFEQHRVELIRIFINTSSYVLHMRDKHSELIEQSKQSFNNIFFYRFIIQTFDYDMSDFSFTVTLINTKLFFDSTNNKILFLGINTLTYLLKNRESNLHSFSFIYNDPLRVKIVELVHQYQPITRKDIFKFFSENDTVLNFQVDLLCEAGILFIKHCTDGIFCLTINQEYFTRIPNVFQKTFGLKQKGEDNP